jgi:hypothetical protein
VAFPWKIALRGDKLQALTEWPYLYLYSGVPPQALLYRLHEGTSGHTIRLASCLSPPSLSTTGEVHQHESTGSCICTNGDVGGQNGE